MRLSKAQRKKLIILLILRRRLRRKRRQYVRGINLKRVEEGEFTKLVLPMQDRFLYDHFEYFRMTATRFDYLLNKIGPKLHHAPNHRMPITSEGWP